jgi:hypothetical protein
MRNLHPLPFRSSCMTTLHCRLISKCLYWILHYFVSNEHSLYYFMACNVVRVRSLVDRVALRQVFACQYYSSHAAYSGFIRQSWRCKIVSADSVVKYNTSHSITPPPLIPDTWRHSLVYVLSRVLWVVRRGTKPSPDLPNYCLNSWRHCASAVYAI